ncbi:putative transposase domain protein [Mycobacterium xenopi 4042]|uniref:Putative transposase domain protein n=1 Tax=Mycobacterium xenopi 4042 TaxID=1299334 RepID=X7ZY71_MYCXE|nr:putative transposase domain protein [Mycobacterium xenopi 4042]EUA27945.1 putative transposase domain protein [Mycobacterium xenopi 3993]
MRADNSIHLIAAAKQRHEQTLAKAIAALHNLDQTGAPISFAAVAEHAGVSRSWLYTQTNLKDEIHRIRALREPRSPASPPDKNQPATRPCGTGSALPTNASVNSTTKTAAYAARSPTSTVNSAQPASAHRRHRPRRRHPDHTALQGRRLKINRALRVSASSRLSRRISACSWLVVPGRSPAST